VQGALLVATLLASWYGHFDRFSAFTSTAFLHLHTPSHLTTPTLRERSFQAFLDGDEQAASVLFLQAYKQAEQTSSPFSAADLYNLASLLHDIDPDKATHFYQQAIDAGFASRHYALHNLGQLATQQGTSLGYGSARLYYRQALEIMNDNDSVSTLEALGRLDLLERAAFFAWSAGLNNNNATAWSMASPTEDVEVEAWCAVAQSSILVSDEFVAQERTIQLGWKTRQVVCTPTPMHSIAHRRICFGNAHEGVYIGTSVNSKKYIELSRNQTTINNEPTKNQPTKNKLSIMAFLNDTLVSLNIQRDHCGHVVVDIRNALRATSFHYPLRDPLVVEEGCYLNSKKLILVNGFHRLFEALSRGYRGLVSIKKVPCMHGKRKWQKKKTPSSTETSESESVQIALARTLLEKAARHNAHALQREKRVLAAEHLLVYNNGSFRTNTPPKLLQDLSRALATIPNKRNVSMRAYKEAESKALLSRTPDFFDRLEEWHRNELKLHGGISIQNIASTGTHSSTRLWRVQNILTVDECAEIIDWADGMTRQSNVSFLSSQEAKSVRTSRTAFVSKEIMMTHHVFISLRTKLSKIIQLPLLIHNVKKLEIQVVRYTKGQRFEVHHDAGPLYPRLFSMFIYLNSVSLGVGGETCFPRLKKLKIKKTKNQKEEETIRSGQCKYSKEDEPGICVQPVVGQSLLWYNLLEDGNVNSEMVHEACPLHEQEKWGLNVWFEL